MEFRSVVLDDEEYKIAQCYSLSSFHNGMSLNVDYAIIKDYSKKHKLDSIEVLSAIKQILNQGG